MLLIANTFVQFSLYLVFANLQSSESWSSQNRPPAEIVRLMASKLKTDTFSRIFKT